ncbi:MAG: hypothetical protein M5U16_05820 [Hyphomicrobium sp.]|nr:hypothetical protein [Hyphomicrobium sp.]
MLGEIVAAVEVAMIVGRAVARIGMIGMVVAATCRVIGAVIVGRAVIVHGTMVVDGMVILDRTVVVHAWPAHLGPEVAHATAEVAHAAKVTPAKAAAEVTAAEAAARVGIRGQTECAYGNACGERKNRAASHDLPSERKRVATARGRRPMGLG